MSPTNSFSRRSLGRGRPSRLPPSAAAWESPNAFTAQAFLHAHKQQVTFSFLRCLRWVSCQIAVVTPECRPPRREPPPTPSLPFSLRHTAC